MVEDENDETTVYTTSKKNRTNTDGMGPELPNMVGVQLQVMVPSYWSDGKITKVVQQAIVHQIEKEEQ